jgi:hypothetical protein
VAPARRSESGSRHSPVGGLGWGAGRCLLGRPDGAWRDGDLGRGRAARQRTGAPGADASSAARRSAWRSARRTGARTLCSARDAGRRLGDRRRTRVRARLWSVAQDLLKKIGPGSAPAPEQWTGSTTAGCAPRSDLSSKHSTASSSPVCAGRHRLSSARPSLCSFWTPLPGWAPVQPHRQRTFLLTSAGDFAAPKLLTSMAVASRRPCSDSISPAPAPSRRLLGFLSLRHVVKLALFAPSPSRPTARLCPAPVHRVVRCASLSALPHSGLVSCAPRPAIRSVPVSSFVRLLLVYELDLTLAISARPSVPLYRTSALSSRRTTTIVALGFSCVVFLERKSLDGEGSEVLGQYSPNVRWNF